MTEEKLYTVDEAGIAHICAWHENAKEALAQAEADGYTITYGCCIECRERLMTR